MEILSCRIDISINLNMKFIQLLQSLDISSCPYKVNLHMHTKHSDGSLDTSQIIRQACNKSVKHISITDHHSLNSYQDIEKIIDSASTGKHVLPTIWTGIEISCLLEGKLVHVLGYDFELNAKEMRPYTRCSPPVGNALNVTNVINAIHDSGGLAILAHPARYKLPFNKIAEIAHSNNLDGLEVWYDYSYNKKWNPCEYTSSMLYKQVQKYRLFATCGTDTHGLDIMCR